MQSKPKANSIITTRVIPDDTFDVIVTLPRTMAFDVLDNGTVELDLSKVHVANIAHACLHGFGQRVPDSAAIGTTDKEGTVIPRAERTRIKAQRMNDVCVHLESGTDQWSRRAEGGTGQTALAVEAFARANDCTNAEAKERIERRAKAAGRTYAKQLGIVAQLFPEEYAAVVAERAASITPAFDADEEMASFKAE